MSLLLLNGIDDVMDKTNLCFVPALTILTFVIIWTAKLLKLAFPEVVCSGAFMYDLTGSNRNIYDISRIVDVDAQRHCKTATRYFHYDQTLMEQRQAGNPEWILWVWIPMVFVFYVLTRLLWSFLMKMQSVDFNTVAVFSNNVIVTETSGITSIDEDKLRANIPIVVKAFSKATSSNTFFLFISFEIMLVLAPVALLLFILPALIGEKYPSWGLDIVRENWQTSPYTPASPLFPRVTYCFYNFVSLGNDHVLTYQCYLDTTWHEIVAFSIWIMLASLTVLNLLNLFFWMLWGMKMQSLRIRQKWVMNRWLYHDFCPEELEAVEDFTALFKMGNLMVLYFIGAYTDGVSASAVAKALFKEWLRVSRDSRLIFGSAKHLAEITPRQQPSQISHV